LLFYLGESDGCKHWSWAKKKYAIFCLRCELSSLSK
jgi:hypothetical protein